MLRNRVITVLWALPLLVAAVWFDWPLPWLTVFAAVWGLLAVHEFYSLTGVTRSRSLTTFGLTWSLLFIVSPHFERVTIPLLLTSGIVLSLVLLIFRRVKDGAFTQWVWVWAGILYLGWLLSYLVALRIEAGPEWLYLALFATFATDTAAYFVGKAIGRHRLAPRISPGKTWEGAVGGVLGAVATCLLAVAVFSLPVTYLEVVVLGVLVGIFAQLGGLAMSMLKRNVGVKDSGTILAGHGGVLDRTDSLLFAGVVVYYFLFIIMA